MRFKRASLLTKIVVTILAVAAALTLVTLQAQLEEKQAQAAQLEEKVAAAQQENRRLEDAIETVDTDEGVKNIARDKLGLADSDEIVFYDTGK
ncbi:MAG: septum formation initiator family protein [Oscillospiraceae bacterium]|nr:septum formation initiator family protein [Oscillospiraceae bacterium]